MREPNPQQREIIRISLLRYISQGNGDLARGYLLAAVRAEGFKSVDDIWLASELQYLIDKELIAVVIKVLSPENKYYRLTGNGRDFLAEQTGE